MRIEEIVDEAEALKLSGDKAGSQPRAQNGAAETATKPELPPGLSMGSGKTVDEVLADLNKSPLFMTELEENDDVAALQALAYEGTPYENAADFKERGNECFKGKQWADAKEFYTKGLLILVEEDRRRVRGEAPKEPEDDGDDEIQKQHSVLEQLYVNRAACHLELRNYRTCWLDCAAALRLSPANVKAYYRSARALLAVGRIEEADDACARGLTIDEGNHALKAVAREIIKKNDEMTAKQRKENERLAREKRRRLLLRAALKARNIRSRETKQPPEMEDAKLELVPDPDDPRSSLSFPAVLLYPAHLQSDFIKAFNETESLDQHLDYIFPLPWDTETMYKANAVECYMETLTGGLIKVGKKAPLLKALSTGKIEVVDEVVRIFVLPKTKADAWVTEFKKKRAIERGEQVE